MTDRPILFSAPMVRALLAGTKTQTRRVLKLPTKTASGGPIYERPDMGGWEATTVGGTGCTLRDGTPAPELVAIWHRTTGVCMTTPIQPGDRLWAREKLQAYHREQGSTAQYCADISGVAHRGVVPGIADGRALWQWKRDTIPSIHMPRWASRLTLIVTDVRVQRLWDISEEDARAEGCIPDNESLNPNYLGPARSIFEALWNAINGPDAWAANPWVAAYTFEVHQQNIDAMEKAA